MPGELKAQRNHYQCESVLKVQNQEETSNQSPRESLRTPDNLRLQPSSAALSTGAETHDGFELDFGKVAFPKVSERGGYSVQGNSYAMAKE